jgi:signal transduction histidine kinase/CHASE3 domain sensor protein
MNFKKITLFFLVTIIALFGGVLYYLFQNINQSYTKKEWELHSQNVLEQINIMLMNNYQQESFALEYSLTGDTIFHTDYLSNKTTCDKNIDFLKDLVSDNPIQTNLVIKIDSLFNLKELYLDEIISIKSDTSQLKSFRAITEKEAGISSEIEQLGFIMIINEGKYLEERKLAFEENITKSKISIYIVSVVLLLIILLLFRQSINAYKKIKHSNIELEQLKNRLHESLSYAKVAAFDWEDTALPDFWVSKSIGEMLGGVDPKKFGNVTSFFYEYMHPEDTERVKSELENHLKLGQNYRVNYRLKHVDGHYINFKATGSSFELDGKKRMIGVIINIEEELALAQSREQLISRWQEFSLRFDLTLKSSNYGVWDWTDINSPSQWWSDTLYDLLGYEKNELSASADNFNALIHPDYQEKTKNAQHLNLTQGKKFELDFKLRTKTMGYQWFRVAGDHIIDEHSGCIRMIGVISDISTERQFLDELERSNQELENFAYVASHDLQEPLRKIQAFGDLLKFKFEDASTELPGKELVEKMTKAAERLRVLIQDLLNYSRISRELDYKDNVTLDEIITEVKDLLQDSIESQNVQFEVGTNLPTIQNCNRSNMIQLFQNLISNAIKFQPENNIPIIKIESTYISIEEATQFDLNLNLYQEYVKICISDNGIGFKEAYLDKIFTIFQRLHGKSEYDGTGLGLAICRKICENHEGYITAKSTLNKGTTFIIILPHK